MRKYLTPVLIFILGVGVGFSRGMARAECYVSRNKDRAVVHFKDYEFAVRDVVQK